MIDLRSDTLTRPDEEMRRAMASAEVGDDVFGEDPTVRRLEELGAEKVGQPAGLFVPSGTMGNQIALHLLGRPGDVVLCESLSHILHYEMGAMAALSGLLPRPLDGERGLLDLETVNAAIETDVPYKSRTTVLALENSANLAGGSVYEPATLRRLATGARERGLGVHLDGARIFNAAVACGVGAPELGACADTVMFCLSKGLGAPVGSLLCSSPERIQEARRFRRLLGGGMRQVGVLAAAGIVALERGTDPLELDHEHARRLAETLAGLPGFVPAACETNIVVAEVPSPPWGRDGVPPSVAFLEALAARDLAGVPLDAKRVRFVTHRDVSPEEIDSACEILRRVGG